MRKPQLARLAGRFAKTRLIMLTAVYTHSIDRRYQNVLGEAPEAPRRGGRWPTLWLDYLLANHYQFLGLPSVESYCGVIGRTYLDSS